MEHQVKVNKYLSFGITTHYKEFGQFIVGITINKDEEHFSIDGLYKSDDEKRNRYEFNLWFGLIGLHMSVRGKLKKIV